MAKEKYAISLRCWDCNATGVAHATDDGNGPNFLIRTMPAGFVHTHYSPNPWAQQFECKCGGNAEYDLY